MKFICTNEAKGLIITFSASRGECDFECESQDAHGDIHSVCVEYDSFPSDCLITPLMVATKAVSKVLNEKYTIDQSWSEFKIEESK